MQALALKVCSLILLALVPFVSQAEQPRLMTWEIDGAHREALVFAPSAGAPNEKHPLIFAFHGHGGNMRGFSDHAALATQWPEAIVVFPQGLDTPTALDPNGRKPGWQRTAGGGNADLKLFDAMLASMYHEFNVDDRRVFATGFSNGAFFSLLLWIERGDKLAAVSIVAGALEPSQHLTIPKPVLHIAGDADPLVTPAKVAATVAEERSADGAQGQGQSCGERCTMYHGTHDDVKFITHPGGHEYPKAAAGWTVEFFKSLNASHATADAAPTPPTSAPSAGNSPPHVDMVHYTSHGLDLIGRLYKPQGDGPFPVYIWNHGSEQEPPPGAKLAQFWVPHGFVLFAPVRSGHVPNTGRYIGDEQKNIPNQNSAAGFKQVAALHERANDDVIAAYKWVAQLPFVDRTRIVIAGGSYGGIQTLLAAERDGRDHLGVKCFVAMSPASESWGNANWAPRLTAAIDAAHAPIFLLQAENDFNLGPSHVLGPRIDAKGPPNRHKIFPPHGDPADHSQGHAGFFSDPSAWSTDVLDFLHACGEL